LWPESQYKENSDANELGGDALSVLNDDTNDPLEKKSEEEVCAWAFMAMQAIQ
jgi:hypothetical protein